MNTTINVSTGFTPFYMLYGTQVALPIDYALPAPPTSVATSHVAKYEIDCAGSPCCHYGKSTTSLEGPL